MSPGRLWQIISSSASGFMQDNAMTLAAALSFYTLLSFAPLLVLGLWLGTLLGSEANGVLLKQIGMLGGSGARDVAEIIIEGAGKRPSAGNLAGIVSIIVTLVGATTLFAQLQGALNQIWHIKAKPGNAIWSWLRRRILSMGIVLTLVFMLIVSLILTSVLALVLTRTGPVWVIVNQLVSLAVFSVLFMLLFRYLADAMLRWSQAFWGGVATSILFSLGQGIISYYVSKANVGGAYGAASSLVILMVWVYYSGVAFLFGAELVQAWINEQGEEIQASTHAVKVISR
jgi:membrane protein